MVSHALLRALDSFFRRPLLSLLPLLIFSMLGAYYVVNLETQYRSTGVMFVEDRTFLSSLTQVRGAEVGHRQTPAGYTSRQLNALLQTDSFLAAVIERSGLADPSALSRSDLVTIRTAISSWESGENLVNVSAGHERPDVALGLADATIETLIEWEIDVDVSESTVAEGFLAPITQRYLDDLTAAREELQNFLQSTTASSEELPASQEAIIDQLSAQVAEANDRYADALTKEEAARLATAQAESDVRNRLQLVDAPELPLSPEGKTKTAVMALAVFMACGALLSLGIVVVGAAVDETVRFPGDAERRLGTEVLAILPDTSPWMRALARPGK